MNRHGAISENQWQWLRELSFLAPTYILLSTPSVLTKCLLLEGYVYSREHQQSFLLEVGDTAQIPSKHLPLFLQYKPCGVWALYEPGKRYSVLRDLLVTKTDKKWLRMKKWCEFFLHGEPGGRRGHMAPGWGWKPHSRVSLHYPVSRKLPSLRGQASHCTTPQLSRFGVWEAVVVVSEEQP